MYIFYLLHFYINIVNIQYKATSFLFKPFFLCFLKTQHISQIGEAMRLPGFKNFELPYYWEKSRGNVSSCQRFYHWPTTKVSPFKTFSASEKKTYFSSVELSSVI